MPERSATRRLDNVIPLREDQPALPVDRGGGVSPYPQGVLGA